MESFEVNGVWWLPENPKEQIAGTLSFNPAKGALLTTIGGEFVSPNNNIDIVCGSAYNKGPITLGKCKVTGPTWTLNRSGTNYYGSKIDVSSIFIGCHFQ